MSGFVVAFAAGDWAAGRGLVPSPLGDAGRDADFVDGAFTAKCTEKEIVAGRGSPSRVVRSVL